MKKILLVALAMMLMLSGCDGDDASYNKGSFDYEETITAIDLQWTDGEVDVVYGNQDYISIYEDTARELTKDEKVRSKIVNGVLKIRYSKDNATAETAHKLLTIELPEGTQLKTFKCNNESGTIVLCQIAITEQIDYTGTSGIFEANLISDIQKITASSDSAALNLTTEGIESINISSINGFSTLFLNELPDELSITGENGDISIITPNPDFTLRIPNMETEVFTEADYAEGDSCLIFGEGKKIYDIAIPELTLRIMETEETLYD